MLKPWSIDVLMFWFIFVWLMLKAIYIYLDLWCLYFVLMLINIFFCLLIFNVRVDLYMHLMIWIKWFLYTHNNFEYFCSVQQRIILHYISRQECFYTNNQKFLILLQMDLSPFHDHLRRAKKLQNSTSWVMPCLEIRGTDFQ